MRIQDIYECYDSWYAEFSAIADEYGIVPLDAEEVEHYWYSNLSPHDAFSELYPECLD